jgi:hypothetical protein
MDVCSIDGCGAEAYCRTLCSRHYNRLLRTGATDDGRCARAPLAVRIWRHIDRRGDNECWPWIGKSQNSGYGTIGIGTGNRGKHELAHRAIWILINGPLPKAEGYHGSVVRHTCHNRLCCNPKHLALGSQADNVADMWANKNGPRGNSRLTEKQIADIRKDKRSSRKLAPIYGVCDGHIRSIRQRRCWR